MTSASYTQRRERLETYFDKTAVDAWAKLTTDAPVSGIRATVRAGRDRMRTTLLKWLPNDLRGARLLDAGCGTGAFAAEAAQRGASVVAVDLSPTLVKLAEDRTPTELRERIAFRSGDMLDESLGQFDYCVAMDSLIHYRAVDMVEALAKLGDRTTTALLFTFAPQTPALSIMHAVGRLFPRSNRAPGIEPVSESALRKRILTDALLRHWTIASSDRIKSGFYTSHAMELRR